MARVALHNRQDSLDRALQLFWEKGFHATSLKDIEKALDMRPGSIYATFGSKDGLFQEALDYYSHKSTEKLQSILNAHSSPLFGLAAYLRLLGGLCDEPLPSRACMIVKSLFELGQREASALDKVEAMLARMEVYFVNCFIESQRLGEIDKQLDPIRLGRRFQAEIMGLRAFAQRDIDSEALHDVAEDMALSLEALYIDPK
ncbi:TetR/AcrR family transcriptional regulator [Psychrobacter aquaticus]|uniref:Transcriptional regulator, TetR family n=1 Tax=Psychrobacter aquaticus CMS 56 TaxID=1354303 RepID=U4T171_9GAMM|nr:TetR/AcrR family transcriptional regulator [Psychrobacter aquaticus]ERL54372.1 Transcriptional regulator, TetR family [Psychrobacter aquaticus CMS 56]